MVTSELGRIVGYGWLLCVNYANGAKIQRRFLEMDRVGVEDNGIWNAKRTIIRRPHSRIHQMGGARPKTWFNYEESEGVDSGLLLDVAAGGFHMRNPATFGHQNASKARKTGESKNKCRNAKADSVNRHCSFD